jgi:hypothetical protein
MTAASVTVTRRPLSGGRAAYLLTGTLNGETYDGEVARTSKAPYTHASVTTLTDGHQVLGFHKTEAAAARGNASLRGYAAGVQVVTITREPVRASHVVVDGHDGYTFWAGADGALFTEQTAAAFAAGRNAEMKPEHRLYQVFALTPA